MPDVAEESYKEPGNSSHQLTEWEPQIQEAIGSVDPCYLAELGKPWQMRNRKVQQANRSRSSPTESSRLKI